MLTITKHAAQSNDSVPQPGDAVICLKGSEIGSIGIIEGAFGGSRDERSVCFNFNAFRDDSVVSASGGPSFSVSLEKLVPANRTIKIKFWRWIDGYAAKSNGEDYHLDVPLWVYKSDSDHFQFKELSLDQVLARKFNKQNIYNNVELFDYPISNSDKQYYLYRGKHKVSYHPIVRTAQSTNRLDSYGLKILESYYNFRVLFFSENKKGHNGYQYFLEGFAFRNEAEFKAYVDAYKLKIVKREVGSDYLIPNNGISDWTPLHIVEA